MVSRGSLRTITSRANPRYKAVKHLKPGYESDEILVEGETLIREALRAGTAPLSLWTSQSAPFNLDCETFQIPAALYRSISPTKSGHAPLAVFTKPELTDFDRARGCFLLLDGLQEPGNAGALVRAAAAFGLDGVVWLRPCVFPYHHACIRASAGSIFHLPQFLADEAILARSRLPLIGAEARTGTSLDGFSWPKDMIMVLGNEGHGLRDAVRQKLKVSLHIPMTAHVESLNVAGAAHILLYHRFLWLRRGAGA